MTQIKSIARKDRDSGRTILRNGVKLALFCRTPLADICEPIGQVLDRYLAFIPAGALKWTVPTASADEWKKLDAKTFARCREQLNPAGARKRNVTAFQLNDSAADAPGYAFDMMGRPNDKDFPDATTLVQMTFPLDVLAAKNVEKFVSEATAIADMLPFVSGYASPGLVFSQLYATEAFTAMRGVALRHPGYDVEYNSETRLEIDEMSRGARWLTFLGKGLVRRLGGLAKLQRQMKAPASVAGLANGAVMLRASVEPEIGDTNKRIDVPGLRVLARAIEPVTWFGEGIIGTYLADFDEVLLRRWERRFLD